MNHYWNYNHVSHCTESHPHCNDLMVQHNRTWHVAGSNGNGSIFKAGAKGTTDSLHGIHGEKINHLMLATTNIWKHRYHQYWSYQRYFIPYPKSTYHQFWSIDTPLEKGLLSFKIINFWPRCFHQKWTIPHNRCLGVFSNQKFGFQNVCHQLSNSML